MADTREDLIRLHRRIAMAGICSRRAAEDLIREGRVRVNGESVTEMGFKVTPDDVVEVDGESLPKAKSVTLVMNKPVGYITTLSDPRKRSTVKHLLPKTQSNVKPVGRLDMDTEGVLLFTNDGELAHRLAHPRYQIEKEYEAVVEGVPDQKALEKLRNGIRLEDGMTAPAHVELIGKPGNSAQTSKLRLVIHEGRNRQVRRMFEAVGHPVNTLRRTRIGFIGVKGLQKGECRLLGKAEVDRLRAMVGL